MRNHDRQEGVGGRIYSSLDIVKVRKAIDWKAAAWNLEGENIHGGLSAPEPADDVTEDLRGT